MAARLGAGSYVLGNVVETGGRLRISAMLHSGDPGGGPGSGSGGRAAARLFQLVDGLAAQLIARQSGGPVGALSRLAALTTDSLAALKAYLEGERHFRAWRDDSRRPSTRARDPNRFHLRLGPLSHGDGGPVDPRTNPMPSRRWTERCATATA